MSENKFDFESGLSRLEEIVASLEKGALSLEASLKLFTEGTEILGACNKILDEAEQKVRILTQDDAGNLTEENFDYE